MTVRWCMPAPHCWIMLGAARSGAKVSACSMPEPLAAPELCRAGCGRLLATRWPGQFTVYRLDPGARQLLPRHPNIEKTMMALILLLVVAVAAFNIVAMLVMVVGDKRTDIAILRTFGASPRAMAAVFARARTGHRVAGRAGGRGAGPGSSRTHVSRS